MNKETKALEAQIRVHSSKHQAYVRFTEMAEAAIQAYMAGEDWQTKLQVPSTEKWPPGPEAKRMLSDVQRILQS